MKKLYFLFVLFLLFTGSSTLRASHVVGVHITYVASGSGYIFKFKMYRDCAGIVAPADAMLCFRSASGCSPDFFVTLPMDSANSFMQVPFNPCVGVGATSCNGGIEFGFQEYNYEGYVSLPPCSDWIVNFFQCCRNFAITNMSNPTAYSSYVETRLDNLNYPGNSSPEFNSPPISYYCVGAPAIIDFSAYDVDGDSLRYEFVPIQDGSCSFNMPLPYISPFTTDQPFATVVPTTFDQYNGQITFTPSALQISVFSYKVNEYRNGQLIGSVQRDDEIVVVGATANPDTISGRVYHDLNSNSAFDGGDVPVANTWVSMGAGNTMASTSGAGKYEYLATAGTYNVFVPGLQSYWNPVPTIIPVTAAGTGINYQNNDFALQSTGTFNDLSIDMNAVVPPVPGNFTVLSVQYNNAGTVSISNVSVQVQLDPGLQFINASSTPSSVAGNLITWDFPSLNFLASGLIRIFALTNSGLTIGSGLTCTATITPVLADFTPNNNTDQLGLEVLASFDPNSKQVEPEGDIDLSFVTSQQWLTYTINFQNLGTAPAQIVKILEGLDVDLDFSTIEFLASSYPCAIKFTAPNLLEFEFFGINLPAASVNEPASHGFVKFRIKPKPTLLPGKVIYNNAQIVFDFNVPIYTNLIHNLVVTTTGLSEHQQTYDQLELYPNPATNYFTIETQSGNVQTADLVIYNMIGKQVAYSKLHLKTGNNQFRISIEHIPAGVYMVELHNQSGISVIKMVKY